MEVVGELVKNVFSLLSPDLEEKTNDLQRKVKLLESRKDDVQEELYLHGKKCKREVGDWLINVENITSEFEILKQQVQCSRVYKRQMLTGEVERMTKEVTELFEQSDFPKGFFLDVDTSDTSKLIITSQSKEVCQQMKCRRIIQVNKVSEQAACELSNKPLFVQQKSGQQTAPDQTNGLVFNVVGELNPTKTQWALKLRVVRVYEKPLYGNRNEIYSLEVVCHDAHGNRVHATVNRASVKQFRDSIKEGRTYAIRNFIVDKNNMSFKTTDSRHRIFFCHKTIIVESLKDDLPKFIYKFKNFKDIVEPKKGEPIEMFDVIGEVVGYDILKTKILKGKETSMLDIDLQDIEKNIMLCTLWGVYAEEMNSILQSEYSKPLVMILHFCHATNFKGLRISTAYDVTKLIVNEPMDEINEFIARLGDGNDGRSHRISFISTTSAKTIFGDIANGNVESRTLSQLCENNEVGRFYVYAQIVTVESLDEWFYLACRKCFKKVKSVGEQYHCDKCDHFDNSAHPRYKLQIRVIDGTNSTSFLLWDDECVQLIEKTASTLRGEIEQNVGDFPAEFEALVDRKILFKVQVKIENVKKNSGPFTVLQLTEDAALISKYKKCREANQESDIYSKMSTTEVDSVKDSLFRNDEVSTPLKSTYHISPENEGQGTCTAKRGLEGDLSFTASNKKLCMEKGDA